jgi:hypothetical protein
MKRLLVLLSMISSIAYAQPTGTINPNPDLAQPSVNEDVPPGGCMPIGLTASGEIVFPIQCRDLIERHRGKDVEQKPAAREEEKPDAVEEQAPKQSEAGSSEPATKSVETIPLPKRVEHKPRERAASLNGCQNYRTYDPVSRTYRGYDGQRRSCR